MEHVTRLRPRILQLFQKRISHLRLSAVAVFSCVPKKLGVKSESDIDHCFFAQLIRVFHKPFLKSGFPENILNFRSGLSKGLGGSTGTGAQKFELSLVALDHENFRYISRRHI